MWYKFKELFFVPFLFIFLLFLFQDLMVKQALTIFTFLIISRIESILSF
jgi:hypothetical protein